MCRWLWRVFQRQPAVGFRFTASLQHAAYAGEGEVRTGNQPVFSGGLLQDVLAGATALVGVLVMSISSTGYGKLYGGEMYHITPE